MGTRFSDIFAASPFKALRDHMRIVHACAGCLEPLVVAVQQKDWTQAQGIQTQIIALERHADDAKEQLRLHLPNSLFMPVSRFDVLELLSVQDKIANQTKEITAILVGRRMGFPDPRIEMLYQSLVVRCFGACTQAKATVDKLDALVETAFKGHEVRLAVQMIAVLDRLERETDGLQSEIRAALFDIEETLPAVTAVFWYQLVDTTAGLANRAQGVGHRLQLLLAR